jgi:endoglucanase
MLKPLLLAGVGTLALMSAATACDVSTSCDTVPVGNGVTVNNDGTITLTGDGTSVTLPAGDGITVNTNGAVTFATPPATRQAASTAPATQTAASAPSPNNTVVSAGSGGSITDSSGNVWTITGSGMVAVNGSPAGYSASVTKLAYVNGTVWQQANYRGGQYWWSWNGSGWDGGLGISQSPLPSTPAQTTADQATASTQTGTAPTPTPAQTAGDQAATASTPAVTQPAETAPASPATGTTSQASGGMTLIGVNISGGEFGQGQVGTNYIYPSQAEISFYASAGMTVIRVPFLIENVMPNPGSLSQGDVTALQQVVQEAAAAGMDVDLDAHDYGMAWGNLITPGNQTEQQFDNFWQQMASTFKGYPNVIFGIMNEPNQQTPQQEAQIDNDAIAAIRNGGANQEILVPGTSWTGAWTWVSSGNAAAINPGTIQDSDNNWVIEVHQYLDADGSGTNPAPITDPQVGVERLTAITQWAQQVGAKLFLGEFGAPQDSQSQQAVSNMLGYMEQNSNVWQGATMWGAGAWWGNYFQGIEPQNLQGTTPGLSTLEQFAPKKPGA